MMYIRQTLADDEELIHIAQFHWVYTLQAVLSVVFGIIICIVIVVAGVKLQPMVLGSASAGGDWINQVRGLHVGVKGLIFFIFLASLYRFAQMMVIKATTEIAITNRRLIYKRGLVARYVGEMSTNRIEGVNVLQSFMGRMLGYGRVLVRGMGVGEVILPPIANPIRFRKAIDKAVHNVKGDG